MTTTTAKRARKRAPRPAKPVPRWRTERRDCECGCGETFVPKQEHQRYVSPAHRLKGFMQGRTRMYLTARQIGILRKAGAL